MAAKKTEREKRKRSRVTQEQLVHLERFFAMDRSPTAARRKEISDMLGMQERQTQIWFQNRRAKAKLQDTKKARTGSSTGISPDTPPPLATGFQAELHHLLHEDEPITIIPCTDLSVGTWRRIATDLRKHDLVAYLCDTKHCLTWFIHSSGYGFKMEISFDIIVDVEFTNAAPGSGLASFVLSQPPAFYLESFSPHPTRDAESVRHWKKCADWTEDQQASKVLKHNLVGSAIQLAHIVHHLNDRVSGSDIHLHSPSYHSYSQEPSPTALDVHPSPPATFSGPEYHYHPHDSVDLRPSEHANVIHERSHSPPVLAQQESVHLSVSRPSAVVSELDPIIYPQYSRHPLIEVGQSATPYSTYSDPPLPYHMRSSLSANRGVSRSFSPHESHQRQYSTGSVHSLPFEDIHRKLSLPDSLQPPGSTVPTLFGTPSPPVLTTPFYPSGPASNFCTANTYNPAISVFSAMSSSDTNSYLEPGSR